MDQEHKDKIAASRRGKKHSPETLLKMSLAKKGKPSNNKGHKGQLAWNKGLSLKLNDGLDKWRESGGEPWNKGLVGEKNPNTGRKVSVEGRKRMSDAAKKRVSEGTCNLWKGGVRDVNATERRIIMDSFEYKQWRRDVFSRDNYTCQICGIRGVALHADHIKPFATYPELRVDVSNGRTLCVPCHKKTDTYGVSCGAQKEKCRSIN